MKYLLLIPVLLVFSLSPLAQNIKDLDAKFMLRGNIYAESSFKDSTALGGFGGSNNHPKKILNKTTFSEIGLFLKIDDSKEIIYNYTYNGYRLFIVNKSNKIQEFTASDSRLYVTAEAFINNKWQPIEYLPSSWCGNSYHSVYLNPKEYWEFDIPKFTGKIKTKIRYCLEQGKSKIYSNEIESSINKTQLNRKEKYNPKGIMDPYND